jgi:hypothetical protein
MPSVKKIIQVMEHNATKSETGVGQYSLENYKATYSQF